MLERMNSDYLQLVVNGYVTPLVVLLAVIANGIVCVVLLQPSMRSPTNALLVALAAADTMTGLMPLPHYVRFYAGVQHHRDWIPFDWCVTEEAFTEHLPTVFHTASVWLTVTLAVQRYMLVCRGNQTIVHRLCTLTNTIKAISAIYVVALLSQLPRFFEIKHIPVAVPMQMMPYLDTMHSSLSNDANTSDFVSSTIDSITTPVPHPDVTSSATELFFVGCVKERHDWLRQRQDIYYNSVLGFRVVAIHLVPCALLVVMNVFLVRAMRAAKRRRDQLMARSVRRAECCHLMDTNLTTLMLVVVVCVFLLVEFPLVILFALVMIHNTFRVYIIGREAQQRASLFINVLITFSYPINFFIYCATSRKFRDTMCRLFSRRRGFVDGN